MIMNSTIANLANAEEKLKINNDSVKTTLESLKNEIDQITKNSENTLKVKYEDLKTKINLEKEKIHGLMIINNEIFRESKLEPSDIKNKKLEIDDLAKPIAATFFTVASFSGILGYKISLILAAIVGFIAFLFTLKLKSRDEQFKTMMSNQ